LLYNGYETIKLVLGRVTCMVQKTDGTRTGEVNRDGIYTHIGTPIIRRASHPIPYIIYFWIFFSPPPPCIHSPIS